jgi:hypothetical protein
MYVRAHMYVSNICMYEFICMHEFIRTAVQTRRLVFCLFCMHMYMYLCMQVLKVEKKYFQLVSTAVVRKDLALKDP